MTAEIPVNYVRTGTPVNQGLTFEKLSRALWMLKLPKNAAIHCTSRQISDLLDDPQRPSNPTYYEVSDLLRGVTDHLSGFPVVLDDELPFTPGVEVRHCYIEDTDSHERVWIYCDENVTCEPLIFPPHRNSKNIETK